MAQKKIKNTIKSKYNKFSQKEKAFIVVIIVLSLLCVGLLNQLYFSPDSTLNTPSTQESNNNNVVDVPVGEPFGDGVLNFDDALMIYFIDVGQGESIYIEFPDEKNMLIDAGSGSVVSQSRKDAYIDFFTQFGITTINYLLLTHNHSDHHNMLTSVIDAFTIETFYYNDYPIEGTSISYQSFYNAAMQEEGASHILFGEEGDIYTIQSDEPTEHPYQMTIYAPGYNNPILSDNVNASSPICVLEYGGRRVIFTGDALIDTEEYFMTQVEETLDITSLPSDVLKVAHHGSSGSTSQAFIEFLQPQYAIISCGEVNTYNHPSALLMNRLFNEGIITYRTNRHGNIYLAIDLDGDMIFMPQFDSPVENNKFNRDTLMYIE